MGSEFDITALTGVSAGDVFHYQLPETGSKVTIGRGTDCDLVLQDPMVSRNHLSVERRSDGFYLVDLGSTHGTFHMGFRLKPGTESARRLRNGDEFKIGEMLFRGTFDDQEFLDPNAVVQKAAPVIAKARRPLPKILRTKRGKILVGLVILLGVLVLFLSEEKKGLPKQRSQEVIRVPNYGVVGYWTVGPKKEDKDATHLDKAQFDIPASDVLIEYSYAAEGRINVLLDNVSVEQLDSTAGSWQLRQLIIRGVVTGEQRRLVFDNLDFPKTAADAAGKPKQWGIRDVRATPLTRSFGIEGGFDKHLVSAMGLIEAINKSQEGLFLLERALQTAAVELLNELKIDTLGYRVDPGADAGTDVGEVEQLQERIGVIQRSMQAAAPESGGSTLKELGSVLAQIDAELWRRVNSRMSQARLAARTKRFIEAHDLLFAAKSMFPAEADYRWVLANRMFVDNKIVPKQVRRDPGSYRK